MQPLPARVVLGALVLVGWQAAGHAQELSVTFQEVAGGLTEPIGIEHAGDGSGRLFVIEQPGRIVIVSGGTLFSEPFLDITDRVGREFNEQGLLGLAFHPDYAANGEFFIHYTDLDGDTVLARCLVLEENPQQGDESSCDRIFTLPQPRANHNGGKLAFGPDGYLYMALGDGGGGGDPDENAQDTSNLYGAILRLDVNGDDFLDDTERDYAIPPDNPFVGQAGADEVWAYGLRNPWRFSFDRLTGDLWTGDVGQQTREEVNLELAEDAGGRNYGWDVLEGTFCHEDEPLGSCEQFLTGGSTLPVLEYSSATGTGHCSVTGGFRYRGVDEPQLFGVYLFADFCSGTVWGTLPNCAGDWEFRELANAAFFVTTFGEDEAGELYLTEYVRGESTGKLHRVTVPPDSGGPELTPSPAMLDFGESFLGDSTTMALELAHTGSGTDAVIVKVFALSDAAHYVLDTSAGPSPCGPTPICLEPGESCTLNVTFEPKREGGFDDLLTWLANTLPDPVSLTGFVPCSGPNHSVVDNQTVTEDTYFTACLTLSVGPNVTVGATAHAEFRAGESVAVSGPFTVEQGASMALVVDPVLAQ